MSITGKQRYSVYETADPHDEEESSEEAFEDAAEDALEVNLQNITGPSELEPNLEDALEEVTVLLEMALNNRFQEAIDISDKWSHVSLYHSLGKATLFFLKAVLTMEREEIEHSMAALKSCIEIYVKKRRQTSSVARVVWRLNYNQYTDEEIHSELVYAECLLMVALITFLEDQNLINLVRGAFRIRSCFQSYKECNQILEQRNTWRSEFSRNHFESGVRMGMGTFNLIISHMPSKILKILEFVGFSGNRSTGFKGHGDIEYAGNLLMKTLDKYPNSAFFLLFAGRICQLKGQLDQSLIHFNHCVRVQNQWKQLHNICHWERMWIHTLRCEWDKAAGFADILREECNWSRATYTYQYATFLYMIMEEEKRPELKEKVDELIASVPGLRVRYAGKTVPCEKYAITQSEMYVLEKAKGEGKEKLVLPALLEIYIWNFFPIMENAKQYVTPMLERVEKKIVEYKHQKEEDMDMDEYGLCLLIRGMCLRTLDYPLQAEECFHEIINNEKQLKVHTFLPPHAAFELGLTRMRSGDNNEAVEWLDKARRNYHRYLLETVVHFRVHCALRTIRSSDNRSFSRSNSLDTSPVSEPVTPELEAVNPLTQSLTRSPVAYETNRDVHLKDSSSAFQRMARKFQTSKRELSHKSDAEIEDMLGP